MIIRYHRPQPLVVTVVVIVVLVVVVIVDVAVAAVAIAIAAVHYGISCCSSCCSRSYAAATVQVAEGVVARVGCPLY